MTLDLLDLPMPLTLRTETPLCDEDLERFSRRNRPYRMERTKDGEITIMTPVGGVGSNFEFLVSLAFGSWIEKTGEGIAFSSTVGFNLPDGSCLSPDGAWISSTRWNALTPAEQAGFPPLCPDFLIEVRSQSDSRRTLEKKMQLWMQNGAKLAWLIDPANATVTVYRPGEAPQTLLRPALTEAGEPATGFKLKTAQFWAAPQPA